MRARIRSAIASFLLAVSAAASEVETAEHGLPAGLAPSDTVPLTAVDLGEITLRVLEARPMLASSPGIKFAEAHRGYPPIDHASVIFYPHVDSGGVKQAFQVTCQRVPPDGPWSCPWIGLRRYLTVEGQAYETRVRAGIANDVARTLIEATRGNARAAVPAGSPVPETAIIVMEVEDYYLVDWGSADGQQQVGVQARLKPGGNPLDAGAWETKVLEPSE